MFWINESFNPELDDVILQADSWAFVDFSRNFWVVAKSRLSLLRDLIVLQIIESAVSVETDSIKLNNSNGQMLL